MRPERLSVSTLALILGAGCLDPIEPARAAIVEVRVVLGAEERPTDTVAVRGTTPIRAMGMAREGYIVGPTSFTYESSDPEIAVVTSLGTVQGISPGEATITATAPNGVTGTATIVVVPATIVHSIELGGSPGAIAFSTDLTRAYVLTADGSMAILDALAFSRLGAISIGRPGHRIAATGTTIYVTQPAADSVTLVSAAGTTLLGQLFVGAGPRGAVATTNRAFVAASLNHTIAVLEGSAVVGRIEMGGEPHELAITRDGGRIAATVGRDDGWYLALVDAVTFDTLGSVKLDGVPSGVAISRDGRRAFVLFPAERRVTSYAEREGMPGRFEVAGSVETGLAPGGLAAKQGGEPFIVVSGDPLTIFHGGSLEPIVTIEAGGDGFVAIRPEGIFAFVSAPSAGVVRIIAAE